MAEGSQIQAEGAYLEWLGSDEKPEYVNPPVMAEIVPPQEMSHPTEPVMSHPCETCGKDKSYTGKECYACRKRRSRA